MNTKFENYNELIDYDMIDTYYDDIKDFKYLIEELRDDRVESQKYIVNANKKIQKLENIINKAIDRLDISGDIPAEKYEWVLSTTIYETREILKEVK